jgi:hypothetical protein
MSELEVEEAALRAIDALLGKAHLSIVGLAVFEC